LYRHWGSVQVVRPIGGVQVELYSFMTNDTRRGWGVSVTLRPLFTYGKDPVPIVQEAGWVPGPVWTGEENLASTGIGSPDRPARSQSQYRQRYPAHPRGLRCVILSIFFKDKKSHYEKLRQLVLNVHKTEVFSGVSYFGRRKIQKIHSCFIRIWAEETHRYFTALSEIFSVSPIWQQFCTILYQYSWRNG
jgi:hypothetical protein